MGASPGRTGRTVSIAVEHAWLQKHPSPAASSGEFHWHPEGGDRELRAGFVERVRGIEPPSVLWQLEPGRVAWGQVFSAIAPTDGRRYVGLVLSVAEGAASTAALLESLAPPLAAPWSAEAGLVVPLAAPAGDAVAVARALISGGAATVERPTPRWIASIERVLPERRIVRQGVWTSDARPTRSDRVAELAVAAWREPASHAARAFTLLCELAVARGESLDDVGRAVAALDPRGLLTVEERAAATADSLVGVLHAWGRGHFDRAADPTLVSRLAEVVALGVLAQLADDRDGADALAEVRWTALLPASRRRAMLEAVAQRSRTLRQLVEGHHA